MAVAGRQTGPSRGRRAPLDRDQVIRAGLAYVDQHGLQALSLHKLGKQLDVQAMSLYNHVKSKHDLLDGVAGALWAEVEQRQGAIHDWRTGLRDLVFAIRDVVRVHPNAAQLLLTRSVLPVPALRIFGAVLTSLRSTDFSDRDAVEAVRAVGGYALGYSLSAISWSGASRGQGDETELQRFRRVSQALPDDTPDELLDVAFQICGDPDPSGPFEFGLDLILNSLDPAHEN